jgi:hypothetical protein
MGCGEKLQPGVAGLVIQEKEKKEEAKKEKA